MAGRPVVAWSWAITVALPDASIRAIARTAAFIGILLFKQAVVFGLPTMARSTAISREA
jgi:hypothetical protein